MIPIKYTEQGEVIIEASTVGDRVKVSITDTGVGMDDETTARIFNPNEQGQQTVEGGIVPSSQQQMHLIPEDASSN
ncbi:ATP-binding protein [Paenibacillus sp. FSL R7-0297]|uniref:sensor histidine kinase n=1 Tax=Paenibacillus sp. FSL R7-0297 TaxID=2921680 RepID=UPI0030FC170E